MKKNLVILILTLSFAGYSQTPGVEKSIFSIQTGFAGLWINNEIKLSSSTVLRSELGLEHDFTVGDHYDNAGFILQPVITIEPRWYYNLNKRFTAKRETAHNSGNFIALKTNYHPDWFVLNMDSPKKKIADLSIVPTWGIKRQIGTHFTYETGLGLGYRIVYLKQNDPIEGNTNRSQYVPYFHLRLGYLF